MTSPAYRANYAQIDWSRLREAAPRSERRMARSHIACPMLIGDAIPLVQAQTDGTWHDSKSSLRENYRRHKVVEVGNDPARLRKRERPKIDRQAVKMTLERAEARFNRGERSK